MPRIYTSRGDPLDFCQKCFPDDLEAFRRYGHQGNGPDGGNCFGYDDDHPSYDDEIYRCEICSKLLTEEDNYVMNANMQTHNNCVPHLQPNGDIEWTCPQCSYHMVLFNDPPGLKYIDRGEPETMHNGGSGGVQIASVIPYQTVDEETNKAFREWISKESD